MRKYLIAIIAALVMLIGGVVTAQDTSTVFCGTLSQADCDLLTQSAEAMKTVKSAGFDFQMELDMSNLSDLTTDHINFRMTGHGAYALDSEGLSGLLLSPGELAQQMDKFPQLMEDAIRAIKADSNIVIFFSDDFAAALGQNGTKWPAKAGFSARLVDGMAYLNLGKLAELDPQGSFPQGWFGFDLAAYYRQQFEQQTGGSSGLSSTPGTGFTDTAAMEKYISIERGEDITLNDQNAAIFKSSIDLGGFYNSPEFQSQLKQQLEATAATNGMSEAGIRQELDAIQTLMDGLDFEITQSIGLDDHYTHQMGFTVNWLLDMDALASASGATTPSNQPPITIQATFQGDLSQFNNAPDIVAPDDAIIIPLDDLDNLGQMFNRPL